MNVTFLGTADALHGGGRGHSALLVNDGTGRFLVDCGATTPQALAKLQVDTRSLDAVILTHLHGDHFIGLAFLLLESIYELKRERPLVIAGPEGTAERIEALLALAYESVASRPRPFLTDYRVLLPEVETDIAGRRVLALRAKHMSSGNTALCLRITSNAKVLAVSGDSAETPQLARIADGADLFACECTLAHPDPTVRHLSVDDIVRLLPTWRARRVVLTHLTEAARERALKIEDLTVADDGDVFRL